MGSRSSYSQQLSEWVSRLRFEDLPDDVIRNTRLRVLDEIGLALAGLDTNFGQSVKASVLALNPTGPCHIFGTGAPTSLTGAAFANGALAQALEFDDTHNRSIVHMSAPSVAAAFALAESHGYSGREVITAIAIGNELSCRLGSVAPGQFHRRGFHPTGLFATFGVTWLAGYLLNLNARQMTNAAGITGSFAAGLLQCWVDGTQSKFLHPGWAAQSGITAAILGLNGTTGPSKVIEGRFGLLASHLQDEALVLDYDVLLNGLGEHWESESASFKPFPVAHVIHPYIDALLRLGKSHDIKLDTIRKIICPVPEYIVGIVCEPLSEKCRPNTDSHGRVSLQFTLAEALVTGGINRYSYSQDNLANPLIHQIADKVEYVVDDEFPGPEQFKGHVIIEFTDGTRLEEIEEFNRGSKENPMTLQEITGKFMINSSSTLGNERQQEFLDKVLRLDDMSRAAELVNFTCA